MNRYEVSIATADFLESNPGRYRFMAGWVPKPTEPYGCILGHMGRIAGVQAGAPVWDVSQEILGMHELDFYRKMDVAWLENARLYVNTWRRSGEVAGQVLRVLADKELRLPKPPGDGYYAKKERSYIMWDEYSDVMNAIYAREITR